jgi:calcium permeable stress-gated cation channel
MFNWFSKFWKIPDIHALQHQSLDAYLYLRYMRMTVVITFVGCCITWPILFPVNITGGNGRIELNMLTFSNVNNSTDAGKYRYFAHVFAGWLFYGFVMYLIFRECVFYINLRQAFLISPFYSHRISSRTVLFTSVPEPYLDERKLRKMFGPSVKNIWITGDTKNLDELVKNRDKAAFRLEKAEVKLIKLANKERQKAVTNGGGGAEEKTSPPADAESGSVAARWIPHKKRPSHRTGPLGLLGKKVDSIDWCRSELARLVPEVEKAQASYRAGEGKKIPGVFIEFRTQGEAETAYQAISHHQALHMSPRHIGITPSDVVWKSLTIPWWQKVIRRYAVLAFIAVLIIFWAIPVAVVGTISNVDHLKTISFLTWLDKVPPVIMGFIKGLLPAVALSILMSLVPVIMRCKYNPRAPRAAA